MEDILINDDIRIKNGDLVIGDSNGQEIEFILSAKAGQFYQFPPLGVGIIDEVNGSITPQALMLKIKNNLEADDRRVNRIDVSGGIDDLTIQIDSDKLK